MSNKKKKRNGTCETCCHCIPIGEGDHICDKTDIPELVIEAYTPGEKYLWCGGKKYCE